MLRYQLSRKSYKPVVVDSHASVGSSKEHSNRLGTTTVLPNNDVKPSHRRKIPNAQHPFITWLLVVWIVVMVLLLAYYGYYHHDDFLLSVRKTRNGKQRTIFGGLFKQHDTNASSSPDGNGIDSSVTVAIDCKAHQTLLQSRQSLPTTNYLPALLYSFPGSGNTWTRLLLEASTGYYTGSMYEDKYLVKTFQQEKASCSSKLLAIKAHPHLQHISDFHQNQTTDNSISLPYVYRNLPKKCQHTDISTFLDKVIFLVRNPFDAIWSEFQRRATNGQHNRVLQYSNDKIFQSLQLQWKHVVEDLMEKYVDMMTRDYVEVQQHARKFIVIRYEDLHNTSVQVHILSDIITFLELPSVESIVNTAITQQIRLHCAFEMADQASIHRNNASTYAAHTHTKHIPAMSSPRLRQQFMKHVNSQHDQSHDIKKRRQLLAKQDQHNVHIFQKEDVYTKEEVCRMWKVIGSYATSLGYSIYNNIQC